MLRPAGWLLGFALGGFFDGILLHQILQWHHLLSNVDAARDLRTQILADGLFHALMYLIAVAGLSLLWRRRAALPAHRAGLALWGHAAIGFGAWHMVDGVASHWLLGIHRIRVDSPTPLAWDLLWFFAFGLVPVLLGLWMQRRADRDDRGTGPGRAAATSLAVAACIAGPVAALPAASPADQAMVLFRPGTPPGSAFDALSRAGARVLWVDASGGLWAVAMPPGHGTSHLYREGALWVSRSPLALGCFSWTKAA